MIDAINDMNKVSSNLDLLIRDGDVNDYRIVLHFDMSITVYIVKSDKALERIDLKIKEIIKIYKIDCEVEFYVDSSINEDDFVKNIFSKPNKIDMGSRRNLSNLLDTTKLTKTVKCPIVSFYSYKGGVGRTTSLALLGAHMSNHMDKKVFILDVDLEAPGLINFFGITEDGIAKNGVVEYIKNKEYEPSIQLDNSYVYDISKKYSGNGSLFMMPAGNLLEKNDRTHFLEGLSRLDFFGTVQFFRKFNELLVDIEKNYKPDVILIDSRTGFNDIFGLLLNKFSDIAVGLFGNDIQNEPGLYFFLDSFLKNKSLKSLVLVNSIISRSISKSTATFRDKISAYLKDALDDNDSMPAIPTFGFVRNPILEDIGTDQEDLDDFCTLVRNKTLNDYVECFDRIVSLIDDLEVTATPHHQENVEAKTLPVHTREAVVQSIVSPNYIIKEEILKSLYNNFPEQYAEDIDFSDDFFKEKFYLRKSMENIFIQDKFILLGGKGTGKTAFYSALQDDSFFENLQRRAQKSHNKFINIKGVSLPQEMSMENNFFCDVSANFKQASISDTDFFYRRFWIVYTWLVLSHNGDRFGFEPALPVFDIDNSSATASSIETIINDNSKFQIVEKDLDCIDAKLNSLDLNCILSFDQLDKMVKPNLWSKAITPFINYCSNVKFRRINIKLFVRRDLFNKLGNLTNKNQLERRSINLEWSIDEMFDFFFKIIFSSCKKSFLFYLNNYEKANKEINRKIIATINRPNSYNQLNADQYLLKPLVEIFFGKHADPLGTLRFGESYDWFYSNLRNADDTISLRPFLDLIHFALDEIKLDESKNAYDYPVISPIFFNAKARSYAVERHLSDIADEEGNELLKIIIDAIRNEKVSRKHKLTTLLQNDFEDMARGIISRNNLKDVSPQDIENLLELNGITKTTFWTGGRKVHTFAFLYKYFLGLRSPKSRRSKARS